MNKVLRGSEGAGNYYLGAAAGLAGALLLHFTASSPAAVVPALIIGIVVFMALSIYRFHAANALDQNK